MFTSETIPALKNTILCFNRNIYFSIDILYSMREADQDFFKTVK